MYVLDTALLSLLERDSPEAIPLQMRLDRISPSEVATTVVTYEEQMRGWLARAAQANRVERMVATYARLQTHIETFRHIPVLPFDERAGEEYERLRKARLRTGTMDLKIAAIALAHGAVLLTRNLRHFERIPGLRVEDWSS
jgi:tRNA(fMet)-specific endonuclease VapC